MLKKFLVVMLFATALVAGGTKKEDAKKVWHPYQFKGTEHFKYSLVIVGKDGKKQTGEYVIDLGKAGDKYNVKINGEFAGNEGSFSTKVSDANAIPTVIFGHMIFNPWLAPLTTTLFANSLIAMYTAGTMTDNLEEGSHWSYKQKDGDKVEFDVKGTCKYAGRKGKLLTMKTNGKVVYESCVDPDVAMPIYVKYADKEGKSYTAIELVEYKE